MEQNPATSSPEVGTTQPGEPVEAPADGSPRTPATVEEVEAQWQHRVSQKDRAHAAAERALRDENDALKRQMAALSQPRSQSSGQSAGKGGDPEVEALRQQLADQQRATEDERQARIVEQRRAKYPALARGVGEAGVSIFTTADEATLAKLNAQYDDGSPTGTFAPTAPRRSQPIPAKPIGEMSKAELEDQLRRSVEAGALKRP